RERRRDRITPRPIRTRFVRLTSAQHKQRNEREYVVHHEEEREHRDDRLEFLTKDDEQQRDHQTEREGDRRRTTFVNNRRPLRKQSITTHRKNHARRHQVKRVDRAQHRHDRQAPEDRVAVRAEDHVRCFTSREFLARDLRHRQYVKQRDVYKHVDHGDREHAIEQRARNVVIRLFYF